MTHETATQLVERLDQLLEHERAALLVGDLDRISDLLEEKEVLIDGLNALDADPEQGLQGLQAKVMRNQALLDGALAGIRNVAARMSAFRKIRRSLETYDESGRKRVIQGEVERKVEKRA